MPQRSRVHRQTQSLDALCDSALILPLLGGDHAEGQRRNRNRHHTKENLR
jgi:hypothetical protein